VVVVWVGEKGTEAEVSPHFPAPDQQLMTSSGG
jgi:hypothetical protein